MSYLSERQCQLCVDRGVASTERRPLGLQMHNARHKQKPTQNCVLCVFTSLYMLHGWRYHVTNLRTSYVTKPDAPFGVVRYVTFSIFCICHYCWAHG